MKDPNSTNVMSRKLAGLLAAACCMYTAGAAQAGDVEIRASANDRVAIQAAQSDLETGITGDGSVASEAAATVSEAVDASALDTAIDAAIESEVAGSIDSSVQRDIQASIENDLVTDVTGSLPLPGSD